jgi:hypothetical protein
MSDNEDDDKQEKEEKNYSLRVTFSFDSFFYSSDESDETLGPATKGK